MLYKPLAFNHVNSQDNGEYFEQKYFQKKPGGVLPNRQEGQEHSWISLILYYLLTKEVWAVQDLAGFC